MRIQNEVGELSVLLNNSKSIVITSHHNPDGDALGSMLGLYHLLQTMGIRAEMVLPNDFPKFLKWLPSSSRIVKHFYSPDKVKKLLAGADLILCLDYNGFARLEAMGPLVEASTARKVLIDHHPNPESPFDILFSNAEVSSTAELVFEIAELLLGIDRISQSAAVCLFVGIMTDTGSFSYACSRPRTFEVVSHLVALGANVEEAQAKVYNNFSESRMKLMGYAVSQKMRVFPDYHSAFISLTRTELNTHNHAIGDTEGLVNMPLAIRGVIFSSLLIENDGYIKVSLRSRGSFPVNRVCREYFNGGGHTNAAGGKAYMTMEEAERLMEEIYRTVSEELKAYSTGTTPSLPVG